MNREKMNESRFPRQLTPDHLSGGIRKETGEAPIQDATWYTAQAVGDGVVYRFPAGALAGSRYLTADMLLDGTHKTSWITATCRIRWWKHSNAWSIVLSSWNSRSET